MNDHQKENWFELYRTAMLELQQGAMTGRIGDARIGIAARIAALKQLPGLHSEESDAIEDALNNLRFLEREEEHLAAEEKKRLLREAMQKLQTIAPKLSPPDSAGRLKLRFTS
jgi:hypothetical protein